MLPKFLLRRKKQPQISATQVPKAELEGAKNQHAAVDYANHYKHWNRKGWLGRSSSLFTAHPKWTKLLQGDFSQDSATVTVKDLKQMGTGGIIASTLLGLAAKPYLRKRRSLILDTMDKMVAAGGQKWFRRLVVRTARAIYDNKIRRGTTIYDPKLETAIYSKFAEYAKRSESFKKQHSFEGFSPETLGKLYFRQMVRENVALNFNFLMKAKNKPERIEAVKYALVGEVIDELTEQSDFNRLELVASVFKEEVPTINQFLQNQSGQRARALSSLLSIEAKAKKQLHNADERNRFVNRVLDYYRVERKELDGYAFGIYATAKERLSKARTLSPELRRIANLAELIESIYPSEILENNVRFHENRRAVAGSRKESQNIFTIPITNPKLKGSIKNLKEKLLAQNPEIQRKRAERLAKKDNPAKES